jgi:hypothetical protein
VGDLDAVDLCAGVGMRVEVDDADRAVRRRASSYVSGITGASPKSTIERSAKASTFVSRCGPAGKLAARIARGPNRAPGRSETRSSVGAPTTATSTPSRAAGSWVYRAAP